MNDIFHLIRRIPRGRLKTFADQKYFAYRMANAQQRRLPGFLIIGAQRSGTTSLFETLGQHPQLIASFWKEIHYFSGGSQKEDRFEKGELWYRAHFALERDLSAGDMTFEATPLYLFHPLVAERIFNLLPAIKLVAILRNPTERAISHYFMTRRKKHEALPMLEVFQRDEQELLAQPLTNSHDKEDFQFLRFSYKGRGLYHDQLERYYQFFPKQRILLLKSEDFFASPRESLRRVFEFLGVDADYRVADLATRNEGKEKGEVPDAVRKYLDDFYRPHNQALYELTGIDFGW